jgi:lipopolysaccharide export system protein LptA
VPPTLQITAPSNDLVTNKKTVTITDDVTSKPVTVTVNGATVTVGTDGTFMKEVTLVEGANTITIVAKDKAGKTTTVTRKVTVDTSAPVIKSITLTPNPVDCGKTFIIAVEITD